MSRAVVRDGPNRPPMVGSQEPRPSLTDRVYAALKKDIITCVLRPGQAFTEKDLTERYSTSRTPVRQAAVRLQEEDLVRIVANRGYFVSQLTIQGMNDIFEFRAAVESACAELLCGARISRPDMSALEVAAHVPARRDGQLTAFVEADTAFHVGIARLTRNALSVRAVAQMRAHTERIMYAAADLVDTKFYREVPAREHMAILHAITRNDPERARELMRKHIIGGKKQILELARRDLRFL